MASNLKSYIMTIIGNTESSKDVMHRTINFIQVDDDSQENPNGLYDPRNYSSRLILKLYKRGVNIKEGLKKFESRFLSDSDKDFLDLIVDSLQKGQHVQVKKAKAIHDKM